MNVWDYCKDVHLLIAEDEPDMLELYKQWIELVGWTSDYSTTTEETISKVNENMTDGQKRYDGVISDINFKQEEALPLTGITAAVQIRKVRPNVPILFVSAWVSSIIREEIRRVSADVLTKPILIDEVFEKMGEMILCYRHKGTGELALPAKVGIDITVPPALDTKRE